MMKMKRLLSACLVVCLLMGMWVVPAQAATAEGTCGDNIVWKLEGSSLTITGTGPMYDYSPENRPPWYDYLVMAHGPAIKSVYVSKGITRIGDYAFQFDTKNSFGFDIILEQDVKEVGHYSFAMRNTSVCYLGDSPKIAEDAYVGSKGYQYYIYGWETSDMQLYGGNISWHKASLKITTDTKTIYNLGEPIKPEDFAMVMDEYSTMNPYIYTPRVLETEPYDNSIPGGKCVKVTVDGQEYTHHYYVTDGTSDCRDLKIQAIPAQYHDEDRITPEPTVLVGGGDYALVKDTHYTVRYSNNEKAGTATVKITGLGDWSGIERKATFAIVRRDIADATCKLPRAYYQSQEKFGVFVGVPVDMTDSSVKLPDPGTTGSWLTSGIDYSWNIENDTNIGDSIWRVAGKGDYYGVTTVPFQITNTEILEKSIRGASNGNITGELNEDFYYEEQIVPPNPIRFRASTNEQCYAYYQLYKLVGEEQVLVKSLETELGHTHSNWFEYDFSAEYEDAYDDGVAVYILGCSWVDIYGRMYTGVQVIYVPARVPDATQIAMKELKDSRDFRYVHLAASGVDGTLGMLEWSSSDPSVAEVSVGTVVKKKPGTVTITAKYKDLQASYQVTVEQHNLKTAQMVYYDAQNQKPQVVYENTLLEEGTDYIVSTQVSDGIATVTVTGRGLFTGQLVREFDINNGITLDHSHGFDHCEDGTCEDCDYTRNSDHKPAELWKKNAEEHWHLCQVCAEKTDVADHTLSAADETVCTVCGALVMPGDVDENYAVDIDDVIRLLLHVTMPDEFSISAEADFDGNNKVDVVDVIRLLLHVTMPEDFPLALGKKEDLS